MNKKLKVASLFLERMVKKRKLLQTLFTKIFLLSYLHLCCNLKMFFFLSYVTSLGAIGWFPTLKRLLKVDLVNFVMNKYSDSCFFFIEKI